MKKLLVTALLAFASLTVAQSLGGTILGSFEDAIGNSTTVDIPNYGTHAVVNLVSVMPSPAVARETVLPLFIALATSRGGTVSASLHASAGFGEPDYTLLFQMINGEVTVYLDGDPFAP